MLAGRRSATELEERTVEEAELEKERGWRGAEERVSMRELGGSPPELQHARARPDARATWQMRARL